MLADAPNRLSARLERTKAMLWGLVAILVVLWLLGFTVFHVAGGLIHLLLIAAVAVVIYRLVTGQRVA